MGNKSEYKYKVVNNLLQDGVGSRCEGIFTSTWKKEPDGRDQGDFASDVAGLSLEGWVRKDGGYEVYSNYTERYDAMFFKKSLPLRREAPKFTDIKKDLRY